MSENSRPEQEASQRGVSIVVPTLNEGGNIGRLIKGVAALDLPFPFEIVVVDDGSTDGTQDEVKSLAGEFDVTLIERGRKMGLASAVVDGAEKAAYDVVLVMDADGSHPVEAVPRVAGPVLEGRVPMCVGSRYAEGGRTEGWPLSRLISSRLATMTALPISPVKDPMSGFFAVRKSQVKWERLRAKGFKIGLEIICRSLFDEVLEVPIVFRDREAGRSKMDFGVLYEYFVQVMLLSVYLLRRGRFRFAQFVMVGLGGMVVDYAVFAALFSGFGMEKVYAQSVSFACAVVNNFVWNRTWTFRVKGGGAAGQLVRFVLTALYAFLLRSILFYWLAERGGLSPYVSLFIVIVAATLVNYLGSAHFAFRGDYLDVRFAWLLAGFLALVKLLYGAQVDLSGQEAYYWDYARHLALSYFDHPPLTAWTIWLTTAFFGDNEFAVRLVGVGYGLLASLGLYLLARDWYGKKTAAAAVVGFALFPGSFVYSLAATPDAPLLAMCFLTAWSAGRAAKSGDNRWFLLVGLFGGLGALSKYTIGLVAVGLVVYGIWDKRLWGWLKSGWVWLGVVVSALVFAPVLVWNYQHGWASFSFQITGRVVAPEQGWGRPLYNVGVFFGLQSGLLTPLVVFAGIWGIWKLLRRRRPQDRLFLSIGLVFVAVVFLYAFRARTKANWTLPGLMLLSLPVFEMLRDEADRAARVWRLLVRWSLVVTAFAFAGLIYHVAFFIPGVPAIDYLAGWRELGRVAAERAREIEEKTGRKPFIIGHGRRYVVATELAFYVPAPETTVGDWAVGKDRPIAFRYWMDLEDFRGRDALYVGWQKTSKEPVDWLEGLADGAGPLEVLPVVIRGRTIHRFNLVHLKGYRPPAGD